MTCDDNEWILIIGVITIDDIPSLLKALYHGPFPCSDYDLFCNELKKYENASLKWVSNNIIIIPL